MTKNNIQMHLTGFMLFCPAPHMMMSWMYPKENMDRGYWHEPRYWVDIATTLEKGCFDMFFFADGWAGGNNSASKKYAIQFPTHDPVELVPYLAAKTEKLGFAVTMSTTFYPPYMLARKLATLDHITEGRIGWNVVTSLSSGEARNFGQDSLPEHDERYDRADEFMEVVNALWESWDEDAMVMDMERGVFAEPDKVRQINYEGKWYKVQGPLTVIPSPQRKPYIFQAGSSDRGRAFAAEHAECVFGAAAGVEQMRELEGDLKSRWSDNGRDPESVKILWGGQPIIGQNETEAREKMAEIQERIPLEAKLSLVAGHFNLELAGIDVDAPVASLDVQGTRGMFEMYVKAQPDITFSQIADTYLSGTNDSPMVGTASQVADYLVHLIEEGGGSGFQITPSYYAPHYFEHIVDTLIPELQKRGVMRDQYHGKHLRDYLNPW